LLKIGVVGCGYWGPNLIRNFNSLPACEVKIVCDSSKERLEHMKGLYPAILVTTDYSDLVNDKEIDAVVIATPVSTHHSLAMQSLGANKHTFIEKPLTSSASQSKELVDLAEKNNLTLMVGHTFIYTPTVRKIKEIIDSGDIGEVMYIGSRRLNLGLFQKDINVAWDLAPHDISIILYLLGRDPETVSCQGMAHINPNIEDVTNLTMNFTDGCLAMIQSSWIDPRKIRDMTIVGTKKMIVYDDLEPQEKIKIYDKRVDVPPHYDTYAEFHYSYHYGDVYSPYLKQTEPLKVECQHFLDCIESGDKSESSGVDGMKVVQILEASSESLKAGNVSVKFEA
jgi:predicted dehydrogenase